MELYKKYPVLLHEVQVVLLVQVKHPLEHIIGGGGGGRAVPFK